MWVEDGELNQMQEWLEESRKPISAQEKAHLTVAEATDAHHKTIERQHKLLHLFNVLQQYRPGWIGLVP